jgi:hypothetical protein
MSFVSISCQNSSRQTGSRSADAKISISFDDSTRVLRIRHDDARDLDVQGKGGNVPPHYVSFDDPHLQAGTVLKGQY